LPTGCGEWGIVGARLFSNVASRGPQILSFMFDDADMLLMGSVDHGARPRWWYDENLRTGFEFGGRGLGEGDWKTERNWVEFVFPCFM
jgi:hypothetical protein